MNTEISTERLLTHLAIRSVIEKYFSCIDRQDWIGLGECFTEDAQAVYQSGSATHLVGRDAIIARLHVVARFLATNHMLSNTNITTEGDSAKTETNAVAHLIVAATGGRVLVRGLRYVDNMVRHDGLWRIHHRIHMPVWQYEAKAMPPNY